MMRFLVAATVLFLCSACSVMMASKRSGIDIDDLQHVCTREEIQDLDQKIVGSGYENGNLTETYQFQKEKGSIARAFMHGILDLSTMFIWEVIGTPIESALSQQKFYTVKVTYDENQSVQKMELN